MNDFTVRLEKIESILGTHLPMQGDEAWMRASFGTLDRCVKTSHAEPLSNPCATLVSLGGKRWRPLFLVLCAELCASAKNVGAHAVETAYRLSPLVEFAHTASLIHDDIEDGSDTRRGKPAAHIAYGLDVALNAGSWLYFQAAACVKDLDLSAERKNRIYELFFLELRRLHLGQAMDIAWHRDASFVPSEEEYFAMVRNKTGTLARLAAKIGVLSGGGTDEEIESCGKIAEEIGVGFQILDDVTNLTTGNPGKKCGDDIVEGKKSLPVILHLKKRPEDKERLSALFCRAREEGIGSPAVAEAISLLNESDSVFESNTKSGMIIMNNYLRLMKLFGNEESDEAKRIKLLFNSLLKT